MPSVVSVLGLTAAAASGGSGAQAARSFLSIREFGTSANDFNGAIAVGASALYVVGSTEGTFPGQTAHGGAFIRKYPPTGGPLWTDQFETATATAVALDGAGSVYLAGDTSGTFPGQTRYGRGDGFVRKYNLSGSVGWTRQFGSPGQDFVSGVAANALGSSLSGIWRPTRESRAHAAESSSRRTARRLACGGGSLSE